METLVENIQSRLAGKFTSCTVAFDEVTIVVPRDKLIDVCKTLRDDAAFEFKQLTDLCGVDYSTYGSTEWSTEATTETGFSRGRVNSSNTRHQWQHDRFAVVYHLVSYSKNQRLRVRSFVDEQEPIIPSVMPIWNCADWLEREAFDMYGIIFEGHPDLRRILTDYGFIGHPLRKDFPTLGHVEMRYDEEKARVVYEPVETEMRVLVPRVIRDDQRYADHEEKE